MASPIDPTAETTELPHISEAPAPERCPWCSASGGNLSLACTDLQNEVEYQVWCRTCWAHGPSRGTAEVAVEEWNAMSIAVRGKELVPGKMYVLDKGCEGLRAGRRIIFRWRTEDGKFNVFSPEGEPDMQSAFSIRASETEMFLRGTDD